MTVFTVGKNGRVYPRKFDHDQARARHAAGETIAALARAYGVSATAVERACNGAVRAKFDAYQKAKITSGVCEDCGKQGVTSATFRTYSKHFKQDGRVICAPCRNKARRTRFRFDKDGALVAVRCNMVDCAHGDRWQAPDGFTHGDVAKDLRPGGFHSVCRDCNTRMRRDHRARNREATNAYDRAYRARRKDNREAAA